MLRYARSVGSMLFAGLLSVAAAQSPAPELASPGTVSRLTTDDYGQLVVTPVETVDRLPEPKVEKSAGRSWASDEPPPPPKVELQSYIRELYRRTATIQRPVYLPGSNPDAWETPPLSPYQVPAKDGGKQATVASPPAASPKSTMGPGTATSTESRRSEVRGASERGMATTAVKPKREIARVAVRQGHAADYRWLVGELSYMHYRRTWHLRYAPVDKEDRHGGSVTLVGVGDTSGFRTGQTVRVEGYFLDPDSRRASPAYRVETIREVE